MTASSASAAAALDQSSHLIVIKVPHHLSGLVSLRAGHPGMVALVHIWHRLLPVSLQHLVRRSAFSGALFFSLGNLAEQRAPGRGRAPSVPPKLPETSAATPLAPRRGGRRQSGAKRSHAAPAADTAPLLPKPPPTWTAPTSASVTDTYTLPRPRRARFLRLPRRKTLRHRPLSTLPSLRQLVGRPF